MENQNIKDVQNKILEIMKYIDKICRAEGIQYFIMGGTALGAVRHQGFIPWDDDLDIFMTPVEYEKFVGAFNKYNDSRFVLQEWKTVSNYIEYSKVRMNGTTFIEEVFKDNHNMHHGIYVDIMILHKVPLNTFIQKLCYYDSKFVTLYGLSQRNWKPKARWQAVVLKMLKFLPCSFIANRCYRRIYKYDALKEKFMYCYWITPASFFKGLFEREMFENPVDIKFEDTYLLASQNVNKYLETRYGDYMKIPSKTEQKSAVHAYLYDVSKDYTEYFKG